MLLKNTNQNILCAERYLVVGLGKTGFSVLRFLQKMGKTIAATDTLSLESEAGKKLASQAHEDFPEVAFTMGELIDPIGADVFVVSPGVAADLPFLKEARARGVKVISDIDLFTNATEKPLIGVTGTNGKSTVVSMIAHMLNNAGKKAQAIGNIGLPVLDALQKDDETDFYVLELSSFQLETTHFLPLEVATILNVTEDHLDRHYTMANYAAIKQRIFEDAHHAVINWDDEMTHPVVLQGSVHKVRLGECEAWGLVNEKGVLSLSYQGVAFFPVEQLPMCGKHNWFNALVACAMCQCVGVPLEAMKKALLSFQPLPHRMVRVLEKKGITYIDDSKATNVGATLAAITSLTEKKNIILLLGGQLKGADPSPLFSALSRYVISAYLYGADAAIFDEKLTGSTELRRVNGIEVALQNIYDRSEAGEITEGIVLLAPACASFDQFRNYGHRGDVFSEWVMRLMG